MPSPEMKEAANAAGGVSDNADWSKSAPATLSAGGPEATFRSSRLIQVSGGATSVTSWQVRMGYVSSECKPA
jgi:hypothetical protein